MVPALRCCARCTGFRYLESIAIAKSFARANGYDVVPSQELVAIGVGNLFSSFFHSFPITGSFSRTAVNSASGVATPLSGLVTGSIVMIALLLLTSMLQYVPKAALSSIIIVAVLKLFNYTIVYGNPNTPFTRHDPPPCQASVGSAPPP